MQLYLTGLNEIQLSAVTQVSAILDLQLSEQGTPVHLTKTGAGIHIQHDGSRVTIEYGEDFQLIRALGLVTEGLKKGQAFNVIESMNYDSLGVMIDCSRNAVLHFDAFKTVIQRLALMGYSTVQMYTEDTYEIEGYPYFGYLRGRYTGQQLQEMDSYAAMFGIELVPCIQTLAHLGPTLRWQAHAELLDCNDILLIDEPKTYAFIEAMFRSMSANLRSRKINIGMDEAHMMGLGKYLDKHGYHDRSSLMLKHFNKVMDIARRYGYEPMMWSDMFFRLASAGEYYDMDSPIRQDIVEMIPDDISLVYWDYYSEDPSIYNGMMKKHKQLSDKIVFAGGAWKWMGFSPNNEFSRHTSLMAHDSCIANGVKHVLMTAWGDNGAEASIYSILPTLQLWAELCYANNADEEYLRERFMTCASGSYDDFMKLDLANLVPDNPAPGRRMGNQVNPQKYLLYQDVLYGLFDKHIQPEAYAEHYRGSAEVLEQASKHNPAWKTVFDTQAALCRVLELKSVAGIAIRKAYQAGDRAVLTQYANEVLPELRIRAEQFVSAYKKQWSKENKIFGLDVFDLRMGGLLQRIDTAKSRIDQFLSGEAAHLEELEQELLYFNEPSETGDSGVISANLWHTIATPSVIAGV